jgi:hypothetical protein
MSITSDANDTASLPMFPPVRSAACPIDPPADLAGWRNEEGLRRCRWLGVEVLRWLQIYRRRFRCKSCAFAVAWRYSAFTNL